MDIWIVSIFVGIKNNGAFNIHVEAFVWTCFIFLDYVSKMELLEYMMTLCLAVKELPECFPNQYTVLHFYWHVLFFCSPHTDIPR